MTTWDYVLASLADLGVGRRDAWPRFPSVATSDVSVPESPALDTLEAMARASDLVLRATVVAVGPGAASESLDGTRFLLRAVTLRPVEILKGAITTALVRFEEPGYTSEGGFTVNGVAWSAVGDEGWYFLHDPGDAAMRMVSSYGRCLGDGPSGLDPATSGPWRGQPLRDPVALDAAVRAATSPS